MTSETDITANHPTEPARLAPPDGYVIGDRVRALDWDGPTTDREDGCYFEEEDEGTVCLIRDEGDWINLCVRWDQLAPYGDGVWWIRADNVEWIPDEDDAARCAEGTNAV